MCCRRRFSAGSRMIDWAQLVASAAAKDPEKGAESACSHPASGNTGAEVGTKNTTQVIEHKAVAYSCSHVPTVPTIFEHDRERHADIAPCDPLHGSGGGEVVKGSAPDSKDAVRGCASCCHLHRPGLSDGYCGGDRTDLPHGYGPGHPLRSLPADRGRRCASWLSIEILNF